MIYYFMKGVGILGIVLFGSRFFVQWVVSERAGKSVMPKLFWYLNLSQIEKFCCKHTGMALVQPIHPNA